MTQISTYIFIPVFLIIAAFALYANFSKKGHNKVVGFEFGQVVEDFGTLQEQKIRLGTQTTRLLHCQKDSEDFLVLETTDKTPGSIQTTWTKINDDMLRTINSIAKVNN